MRPVAEQFWRGAKRPGEAKRHGPPIKGFTMRLALKLVLTFITIFLPETAAPLAFAPWRHTMTVLEESWRTGSRLSSEVVG